MAGSVVADAIASVADLLKSGIDKIWPDPKDEAAAKVALLKAQADAAIAQLTAANAAAIAEANSSDPWTSRARPSFLYVFYIMLLSAIPMGVVSAISPETGVNIAAGFQAWLAAIPDSLWNVAAVMFSVYSGGRTIEKVKGVA